MLTSRGQFRSGFNPVGKIKKFALNLVAFAAVSLLSLGLGQKAFADGEVILNPGFISGNVAVGSEEMNYVQVSAYFSPFSANTTVSLNPPQTSTSYTLTVNVPQGTTPTYNVSTSIYSDSWVDYLSLSNQPVVVTEFQTSTLNLGVANPGFIEGTATVTGGGTLNSASMSISPSQSPYIFSASTSTNQSRNGEWRIALPSHSSVRVSCYANINVGGQNVGVSLPQQIVSVSAGQTTTVNCSFPTPPPADTGNIVGNISMTGPLTPDRHRVYASGPQFKQDILNQDGPFEINDLKVGSYYVSGDSWFNNFKTFFRAPRSSFTPAPNQSQRYDVTAGDTLQIDIASQQAFIQGTANLSGSTSNAILNSFSINANGVSGTPSQGGSGSAQPDLTTGSYQFVLTDGDWRIQSYNMNFYDGSTDPTEFLSENLYFNDQQAASNPITASSSNPVTHNVEFPTGEVTITFTIAGNTGATMSYPSLNGNCQLRDPATNQLIHSYSFNSTNSRLQNVEEGFVRFFGMEGTCNITARAQVNGSNTTFGSISVDVVPGTSIIVDIGGPTLTVNTPAPNSITSDATTTVTGTATDDVEVASVTVNGINATLTSTNNPNDPNEVSFSVDIPLVKGPNEIETIATDTANPPKQGSDTRTVFRDDGPPVLGWTPADGSTVGSQGITTPVTIEGTADDDAGIDSILVDGVQVAFQSTSNPSKPNEVEFSVVVNLADGDNFVTVVANDISTQSNTQTHKISVTTNQPPVADAGPDQTVEQTGPAGADVTLDGSGSSDPDNDPLTYLWSGPFGTATGVSPTVQLPPGTHEVTLTVNDGSENSAPDTVTITVQDTTPPVIIGPANVTACNDPGQASAVVTFASATATDNSGSASVVQTAGPASGSAFPIGTTTVSWTATDAAGNTASVTMTVTVTDCEAPVITTSDITVEATGPTTPVDIASVTSATDNVGVISGPTATNSGPFPVGSTTVTWTACDAAGNCGTATQTVTVTDTTAPDLTNACLTDKLWPPNHELILVTTGSSSDLVDPNPTVSVSVTSNQPLNGTGDGNTDSDWETVVNGDGTYSVKLRAERAGNLGQRDYTVTVTATDVNGNSSSATCAASVPHDQGKGKGKK